MDSFNICPKKSSQRNKCITFFMVSLDLDIIFNKKGSIIMVLSCIGHVVLTIATLASSVSESLICNGNIPHRFCKIILLFSLLSLL